MVYTSDYYNSRRPAYYKPATSYSYTPLYSSDGYDLPPTYYKAHQVYQTSAPFILTPAAPMTTGKPSPNVLPYNGYPYNHHYHVPMHRRSAATMHGVIDRIEHRPRSHPSYDPTDEYLNSRSATNFDDVTRDIRAQTAGLLKQVYTPTIRPKLSSVSNGYSEVPIAQRIESDAYIEKILSDSDSYRRDNNIGKGHLACVSYAGGRAYPRRRPHLSKEVDDNITMLSYYNKTREAVAASKSRPTVKVNSAENHTFNKKERPAQDNFSENLDAEKEADEEAQLSVRNKRAAEAEAARLAAEEEAARLEAEREKSRLAAEEEKARLAAEEEKARLEAEEEKDRLEAEEKARLEAEEKARLEAEENARLEAEEKARLEAEEKARLEAEERARLEAEEKSRLEAEERARFEAEEKARLEAEEEARIEAEQERIRLEVEQEKEMIRREDEAARLLREKECDESEEVTTEEEIEEYEQKIDVCRKDRESDAGIGKSSITTTSTEIINDEDDGVKTTAIFQRRVTKTTTVTSSSSVVTGHADDINSKVEINEVIEDNSDSDEDDQDAAQAEGKESSEEEDESEEGSEEE